MTRVGRRHRSPGTGGLRDGLRRGEKIAIARGEWRFGEPSPDAPTAPPEAHESLVSRETVAEVPLTGLSFAGRALSQRVRGGSLAPFKVTVVWAMTPGLVRRPVTAITVVAAANSRAEKHQMIHFLLAM